MRFSVSRVSFSEHPAFGSGHFLAALEKGAVAGFPLLECTPEAFSERGKEKPLYIAAGQQPMLLLGPLYVFLKALSCIRAARDLSEVSGRDVRPLFWIASEDHDVTEVNRVRIGGKVFVCPYRGSLKRGEVPPVSDIPLEEHREAIIRFLKETLPESEFTPWLLDAVEACSFADYGRFFGDLLSRFLGERGLETVEPRALRERTAPVLARLVRAWPESLRAFREGADRLSKFGFTPPLRALTFFEFVEGKRRPVEVTGEGVCLSDGRCSFEDAAVRILAEPERFSPGAALRPVVQDGALPVLCTVAGPVESLYLWQVRELYRVAGVRPSCLLPRVSATFIERKVEKKLRRLVIPPERVFSVPEILSDLEKETESTPGAAAAAEEVAARGRELLRALEEAKRPGSEKWIERTRRTVGNLVEKAARRLREEGEGELGERKRALRSIMDAVLPGGKPQERVLSAFDFLSRYGPGWIGAALEDLDPWVAGHRVAVFSEETDTDSLGRRFS